VPVTLHSHSVDVVSVFLLNQYSYAGDSQRVAVQPGDVVLDVGGCWGDTALYFASLVGSSGKVFTFEFDPESLAVLRANLNLNPELASRIEVIEEALWDRSGETLEFLQAGRMTSIKRDAAPGRALPAVVSTITLDDFVQRAGIQRLDFVKMDVEGAELDVLRGARESLSRFAPRLAIAAYHQDDDLVRIPQAIDPAARDYSLYLDTFSAVQEETVLFASTRGEPRGQLSMPATARKNST
jgi:FkbM family methyltransferase